jgi:hypothetical protein
VDSLVIGLLDSGYFMETGEAENIQKKHFLKTIEF